MTPHEVMIRLAIMGFSCFAVGVGFGILYAEARARIRREKR